MRVLQPCTSAQATSRQHDMTPDTMHCTCRQLAMQRCQMQSAAMTPLQNPIILLVTNHSFNQQACPRLKPLL
jgi:hypothetical protein